MLEKLAKTRQNTFAERNFKATEAGASFAKKEVSFIPYEIYKKTTEKGVEKKKSQQVNLMRMVNFSISILKQQILKLPNLAKDFLQQRFTRA